MVFIYSTCEPTSLSNQPIRCKDQLTTNYIRFAWHEEMAEVCPFDYDIVIAYKKTKPGMLDKVIKTTTINTINFCKHNLYKNT